MTELEQKFLSILKFALEQNSSDVHFMTGQPPAIRAANGLAPLKIPGFTAEEMETLIGRFLVGQPGAKFADLQDLDGSFQFAGLGRFRFNVYRTNQGLGMVLRVIAGKIPSIEELKLPLALKKISDAPRGLVLVTGATGSGKSSTLAAMINEINLNQNLHVVTVEDPIEFVHAPKRSRFSQREIGRDTASFAQALKSALRQDPDVILVGEMRDIETLDIALKAAETGHLVFSTVHTSDALRTIGRLVSLYPPEEQSGARIRLAENLYAIVSQRLIPAKGGGKVVAQEILVNNVGIADCIMNDKKTGDIPTFVEKGSLSGMQTFDQHLQQLLQAGAITMETALAYATNPSDFERNLAFGASATEQPPMSETLSLVDVEDGAILELGLPAGPPEAAVTPPPIPKLPRAS